MTGHRPQRPARTGGTQLVAAAGSAAEAEQAIADGADLIDASGLTGPDVAALRARHPGLRLWHGSPAAVDADLAGGTGQATGTGRATDPGQATGPGRATSPAAVVATAAVLTWLGAPAIRTRHVLPVRRAIDMTGAIAGTRLPALTIRGLA
jgi:hypothetical protein